ncbi:MAG: bis(5'-nucleosyl)-tetraphosphatase [Phycisphaerales bacterium]|nr:bis(5'-nucleosyl)-tetraphosphatase [Phycisphaerales bacterium]
MAHDSTIVEKSAGVVLFRRSPRGRREYLLLDYGRHWDFPKGHLEPGEDDLSAALRELREETGIEQVRIVPGFRRAITYFFRSGKQLVRKTVVFFLAQAETSEVRLSREHAAAAWLEYPEALERITHASAGDVLKHAEALLSRLPEG